MSQQETNAIKVVTEQLATLTDSDSITITRNSIGVITISVRKGRTRGSNDQTIRIHGDGHTDIY